MILLVFGAAVTVVVLPFVMTVRVREERGITLRGRVYHKSETVSVSYSGWQLHREATIEHPFPETGGVSFFGVQPDELQYDSLRTGQPVDVRYLRRRDLPKLPLTDILWQIHALPIAALQSPRISRLSGLRSPGAMLAARLAGGLLMLVVLWAVTRARALGWVVAAAVAGGVVWLFIQDFPRATPDPNVAVRHGIARVQSISHIDSLFEGSRTRGFDAEQPIDIVGVEFIPEGRTEAVVAVDLIDRGSLAIKEGATAPIEYEANSPRTAHLAGAKRTFPVRNFHGAVVQCALSLGLLLGGLAITEWIRRRWRRLTSPERLASIRKNR
jgi:hypothetical protein